jgi:hypothetical protein
MALETEHPLDTAMIVYAPRGPQHREIEGRPVGRRPIADAMRRVLDAHADDEPRVPVRRRNDEFDDAAKQMREVVTLAVDLEMTLLE